METTSPLRCFLGANSRRGFFSLYDGFTNPAAGEFLWVIKGGPGCGKSTLMKRIGAAAEAAGEPVEYVLCSGDPDSLDGVRLPGKGVAYVDGTAPHVIECSYPGASSRYLDMSRFLDARALAPLLPEIVEINRRYKALYAEAYGLLDAGAALLPKNMPGLCTPEAKARLEKRVSGIVSRSLPKQSKPSRVCRCFLSAISCQGRLTLTEAVDGMDLTLLSNTLGLGHTFLALLAKAAEERGYDLTLCPDPLEPEKLEAVLIPEAMLAFAAAEPFAAVGPARRARVDALASKEALASSRKLLRSRRRDSALLLRRGMETLAAAKEKHDALEALYRPHVDFAGADALAAEHIRALFC